MSATTEAREWPCHYCGKPVLSYWYTGAGTISHGACVPRPEGIPRIEEEDWREEDRRRFDQYQLDQEHIDPDRPHA